MSVNKVILLGFLGNDPDVRATQGGSTVTTISLATTKKWRDKQSGEMKQETEWSRVVFFGKLAEIAGQYLKKGSQVYVEGSLRTNKYTDKNGIERYSTDINANELQMLGGAGGNFANNNQGGNDFSQAPQNSYGRDQRPNQGFNQPHQNQGFNQQNNNTADFDNFDDDVPF